jgi:hypothetical protein
MSPDIARRLVASLKYDVINGSQDEKAIFASQVREATSYINSQAAQIKALKEKLHHERVAYLRAVNSYHKKDGLEYVAREQLKAEMPEVEW